MKKTAINLDEKFGKFSEHWQPKVIAEMNDYQFKLAKLKGEFTWHQHDETDEVFLVTRGLLQIAFQDETVTLKAGEMLVVPKGVSHKPIADQECEVMLIEPRGVVNTGAEESDLKAPNDVWI